MNVLTHCQVSLDVLKNRKLTANEEALLFLGSFIPDVSEFGLAPYHQTHLKNLEFLNSLDSKYYYFGLGVIFHGEEFKGVDYYAHGPAGYIKKKEKDIIHIIKLYKKVFSKKTDFPLVAHIIIEFCFEYLTAEKNPRLMQRISHSIKNPVLMGAVYNFANFFNINRKYVKTILRIGKTDRLEKFVSNFASLKGTAHNLQNFLFLKNVRDKSRELGWLDRLTKSSYGYLKSRFLEKRFEQMFARCIELIRKDYDAFMNQAVQSLRKTVQEKKL